MSVIAEKDARNYKKELRRIFLKTRSELAAEDIIEKSAKIMSRLFSLSEFRGAKTIMFYVDAGNEVKTRDGLTKALSEGKRVVVPKVKKGYGLLAIEIKSLDELSPGTFGILEPAGEKGISPEEIDLVVVPGVAFDKRGNRMGYGAGYYDSFLPKLRPEVKKVAVAFEIQVTDSLPAEEHDVKMDLIITENTIYN
ncbi:5-formyltetrahydrofolate cyclo-ligase [Biomaibacter acetigenes]|uniref:5-formyltetrahydrofolate cyclo-ligase n=1 Tax=Biomaibacter acetigenes TaxID=2316383 RepID=A0A3G2R7W4_9FIRM|nr:5-formyltetrahydrofolate cyclo-ligase [Biomaibacter acetigenes]AYO31526.1 5-formyltetrahydrofolate cyclo-ligase [Biomaibacter acetigenes]